MVVTFLGWWAWTARFFCLLANEIPTGARAAGGQGPGARLFSEQAAASECGMKNLASHQAKRSAAAALPAAGRRSKSKGQKTKAARWCIKSVFDFRQRGRSWVLVPSTSKTNAAPCRFTATGYATRRNPSLSESATSGQPIRTPASLAETPNSPRISRISRVVRTFSAGIKGNSAMAGRCLITTAALRRRPLLPTALTLAHRISLVRHGHLCERISQVNSLRVRYDAPYLTLLGGDRPVSPGLIALACCGWRCPSPTPSGNWSLRSPSCSAPDPNELTRRSRPPWPRS